ncbi:MAG: 4'-phosphopantetheinyl transferase superfamily protein [Prochlorococcus sp.]
MAGLWNIPALDIPLQAPPGKPPELPQGWGFISFSHCQDALMVGWASQPIGVDLERADRQFAADLLAKRYFSPAEQEAISCLTGERRRAVVLENWLIKEAAIKWQRGSLAADLSNWCCCLEASRAVHQALGLEVSVQRLEHGPWGMAVACNTSKEMAPMMLCVA